MSSPRIRAAIRQAERNLEFGKRAAAIQIYREVLADDPDVAAAWAGLGDALSDPREREEAYEKALALDSSLTAAQTSLARLRGELPPEPEPEPPPEPPAPVLPTIAPSLDPEPANDAPGPILTVAESYETVCYRHPDSNTSLRCYTCGKPICIKCANKTPVGYSCPDCLREKEKDFYTAGALDYLLAFFVTLPLSVIGAAIANRLGWFIIFIAPFVGTLIGRVVFWAVRRRRGRRLPQLVVGTIALGALISSLGPTIIIFLMALMVAPGEVGGIGQFFAGNLFGLLFTVLYIALAGSAAFYTLRI
jgi:hypothetical protein